MRVFRALAVIACLAAAGPSPAQRGGAQEGLPAPKFSVRPVNGPALTLAKLVDPNGGVVALVDPRNRAGQRLLGYLDQMRPQFTQMGLGVVVVVIGYSQQNTVQQLVRDQRLTVPVVHDQGNRLVNAFGAASTAVSILLDQHGTVVKRLDATEDSTDLGPPTLQAAKAMVAELSTDDGESIPEVAEVPGGGHGEGQPATPSATPAQAAARIELGWKMVQLGHLADALADATKLHQERAGDYQSTLWLAYVLEAARRYPEAAVTYRKALELQPASDYARAAVARIDPAGRYKTAADLPRPVEEQAPDAEAAATTATDQPATDSNQSVRN